MYVIGKMVTIIIIITHFHFFFFFISHKSFTFVTKLGPTLQTSQHSLEIQTIQRPIFNGFSEMTAKYTTVQVLIHYDIRTLLNN